MFVASLVALGVLIAVHVFADRMKFLDGTPRSRWLSAAGGISLAYVFLHLLPELAEGQEVLMEGGHGLSFLEFEIYGLAMVGLLAFYGTERMVRRGEHIGREDIDDHPHDDVRKGEEADEHPAFWLHLACFALYNAIVGYLLLHRGGGHGGAAEGHGAEAAGSEAPALAMGQGEAALLLTFAVAMALHFLVTDYGLREDFRRGWMRTGRWVLSASLVAGWLLGAFTELPEIWVLGLVALLGGGVILNVLKEELPEERQSRFGALVAGAAGYAALLTLAH